MWSRVDAGDLIQTNVSIRVPWEIIKLAMQQSCGVIVNDMDKINQHQTLTKHDKKARNVCRADAMHGRGFPQETNPNPITYHVVPGKIKAIETNSSIGETVGLSHQNQTNNRHTKIGWWDLILMLMYINLLFFNHTPCPCNMHLS